MIEFPRIFAFCELAECLNFTEAAERLYMTQSSLSKIIAKFEETVNCKLFIRTNRSVELTPAGKYLYEYFTASTKDMHQAIERARRLNDGTEGRLDFLGYGNVFARNRFVELMKGFKDVCPGMDISFSSTNQKEARKRLLANRCDLLLTRKEEVEAFSSCDYITVDRCSPMIIMSSRHPVLQDHPEPELHDLKDCAFVTMTPEYAPSLHNYLFRYCQEHGFVPQDVKTVEGRPELLMEVSVNDRIAILDDYEALESYDFRSVPIDDDEPIDIVMAWNLINTNPAVKMLTDYIQGLNLFP